MRPLVRISTKWTGRMRKFLTSVARVQYRSWSFNVDVPSDASSPFPFLSLLFCSSSLDILDSLDRSGPDINLLWTFELNKPRVYLKLYLIVLTLFNDGKYGLLKPTRGKVTTLYGQRKWWWWFTRIRKRILSFVHIIIIIIISIVVAVTYQWEKSKDGCCWYSTGLLLSVTKGED